LIIWFWWNCSPFFFFFLYFTTRSFDRFNASLIFNSSTAGVARHVTVLLVSSSDRRDAGRSLPFVDLWFLSKSDSVKRRLERNTRPSRGYSTVIRLSRSGETLITRVVSGTVKIVDSFAFSRALRGERRCLIKNNCRVRRDENSSACRLMTFEQYTYVRAAREVFETILSRKPRNTYRGTGARVMLVWATSHGVYAMCFAVSEK